MGERTWRILDLFSGDRRHGDPQKVSGDGGENGKLTSKVSYVRTDPANLHDTDTQNV